MSRIRTWFIALVPVLALVSMLDAKEATMKVLFEFTGETPAPAWGATNDGVMGGLSKGGAKLVEGGMLFSGRLSLENNGGFSWIHQGGRYDLSGHEGIRFSVMGDGRTYQLRLNTDARFRSWGRVAFSQAFETVPGKWVEVFIPFDEFEQSWRGRSLTGHTFDPATVERIGFMLADKKPGPFEMKVRWLAVD